MAQQVKAFVTIAGETVPFSSFNIRQDLHTHHNFEIILLADAFKDTGRIILQHSKDFIGKECHIKFGADVFQLGLDMNEFIGLVTEVGLQRTSNGERCIVLQGYSPTILLNGHLQNRAYTEMNLADIVNVVLENVPHSLDTSVSPSNSFTIPYLVQYKEGNYSFLQRIATTFGEWCFYNGTQFIFGQLPREDKVDLPLQKNLSDFEFSFKLIPFNYNAFSYNYERDEVYSSESSGGSVDSLDEFGKFALDTSNEVYAQVPTNYFPYQVQDQQQLDDWVNLQKTAETSDLVMLNGQSDNPKINVGTIINITGGSLFEEDYGEFIVTSIWHKVSSSSSYQNTFMAIPAEVVVPPPPKNKKQPRCEIQSAVVVDNADPDCLGRVKVKFPWMDNNSTTSWTRVIQPYGGKAGHEQHGFYFIPEIGTEVIVGFENFNPDFPVILGSVFNGNSRPEDWCDSDNFNKVIKTRNGNQIHLIDRDGSEEIKILNKSFGDVTNEISLSMSGSGTITIKTKGQLNLFANSIHMKADEDVKIEAGKNTTIDTKENLSIKTTKNSEIVTTEKTDFKGGKSLSISTETDISMKTKTLDVNATTKMTLNSKDTEVKGTSKLGIDGGDSSLTAKKLDIKGGSQASLTAGMIKFN